MSTHSNWLLPAHLADILPTQARRIEDLRRQLLDLFRTYGFELVQPPLFEFTESLYAGQRKDLALITGKLIDQLSGRTMGIRADMTPQVTRIDAHLLNRDEVTRLCYCGPVFHAVPSSALADRELLQIGAEIYGHAGYEADALIISLALKSLELTGVKNIFLDINHTEIARVLIEADQQLTEHASKIYRYFREKDLPSLNRFLERFESIDPELKNALCTLPRLYGGLEVIAEARQVLPDWPVIHSALEELQKIAENLHEPRIDLADVRGYDYHTGLSFAVYAEGWHDALVRGGRYDNVSKTFGRARPATGFSLNLRKVVNTLAPANKTKAIKAPWSESPELLTAIEKLRQEGKIVIQMFPGQSGKESDEFFFEQEFILEDSHWVLKSITQD